LNAISIFFKTSNYLYTHHKKLHKSMNKIIVFLIFSFLLRPSLSAQTSPFTIIPQPTKLVAATGNFTISNKTAIYVETAEARLAAKALTDKLKIDGTTLKVEDLNKSKTDNNVIFFLKTDDSALGTEGYRLSITPSQINIRANTPQGMYYAVQSLLQLMPTEIFSTVALKKRGSWKVPCAEIEDQPRFSYRGLHLDVSRHFFSVSFIKKYIDMLALHKMNTFHWHLTDDQGWRIEIKKYPKLTEIGSKRKETMAGHYTEQRYDGTPYSGFYTQNEIKDIVAYAKERFITIIPEIEMPGHALAALASYPELSCDSTKKYEVGTKWGVYDDVFCPSEKTFAFLQDVLAEVIELFPSKYIHVGGDECPKDAWKKSAFCQDLMKKQGLKDEHELQSYFIQRIEKYINSKGRSIIGWDEILEGGLAPNATVMSWRGTEGGIAAAKQNHDVVMTPGSHCYFDYYQAEPETEPLAIGGFVTLEKTYSYEPIPKELTEEQAKHILGAQGNVWSEYMTSPEKVEYMVYPRATALAEVLWSQPTGRNYADFFNRLQPHLKRLDALKINYAKRLNDVKLESKIENKTPSVSLTSPVKNAEIRYTTDGTEPKLSSNLYTKPFEIKSTTSVRATAFQSGKMISKSTSQKFYISSALNMKYEFAKAPNNTYESGDNGLTNGIRGTEKSYAQWVGFTGNDMDVTFDFENPRSFTKVAVQFLNRPESWIFLPDYVILSVSNDGKEWLDINRADFKHTRTEKTYMREAKLQFSEFTKPKRYLKIFAKNIGKCPKGHPAEGQAAWLFADEVIID
jgi:hexosaminidase